MKNNKPSIITFPKIGASDLGYISVAETQKNIPFEIQRVYWAYYTPDSVMRGFHAHHKLEQILIAVSGSITLECEMLNGEKYIFELTHPNEGVYMPAYCWHTMKYSHNSVQLCIANMTYDEADYIRDYDEFKKIKDE